MDRPNGSRRGKPAPEPVIATVFDGLSYEEFRSVPLIARIAGLDPRHVFEQLVQLEGAGEVEALVRRRFDPPYMACYIRVTPGIRRDDAETLAGPFRRCDEPQEEGERITLSSKTEDWLRDQADIGGKYRPFRGKPSRPRKGGKS